LSGSEGTKDRVENWDVFAVTVEEDNANIDAHDDQF